jgi:hypothetical protein
LDRKAYKLRVFADPGPSRRALVEAEGGNREDDNPEYRQGKYVRLKIH